MKKPIPPDGLTLIGMQSLIFGLENAIWHAEIMRKVASDKLTVRFDPTAFGVGKLEVVKKNVA